jgi:hypothetical protein
MLATFRERAKRWLLVSGWRGRGRVVLSKSGGKLVRDLFDHAMKEPARLDFCGGAICRPPLEQRRGSPVVLSDGGFLDTRAALPDLTASEQARVEGLQAGGQGR